MANNRIKGITIEIGGDVTGLNKALEGTNQKIKDTQTQLRDVERLLKLDPGNVTLLEQQQRLLAEAVDETTDKLDILKDAEKQVQKQFERGEVSQERYEALQREIISTSVDLEKLQDKAQDASKAINRVDEAPVEDVEDAAKKAGRALDDAADDAFDLGDALTAGAIVEGIKGIADSVADLAESTKEYRKIMGTLEVSSQQAGYTAEETEETYKQLYAVLGDEQAAATTVANLQALKLSQKDLSRLVEFTTGAWAKYGDSIPIDGLAESINETIRTGQVTGTLADVLNWGSREGETFGIMLKNNVEFTKLSDKELKKLTETQREEYEARKAQADAIEDWNKQVEDAASAEDYFNLALEACGDQSDRANLLLRALSDQGLGSLADAWTEANGDIVKANESQAEFTEKTAEMAERLAPLMQAVSDGVNDLLDMLLQLSEDLDYDGIANKISEVFDAISNLVTFITENYEPIMAILAGIGGGLAGLKLADFIENLITAPSLIKGVADSFPLIGNALGLLGNPFFVISGLIVGLTVLFLTHGEEILSWLEETDAWLQGVFATDWTTVFGPVLGGALNGFLSTFEYIWNGIRDILSGLIDFIQGAFSGDWERALEGLVSILDGIGALIAGILAGIGNTFIGLINAVIDGINWLTSKLRGLNIDVPAEWGGGSFTFGIPEIPNVPYLAKGGILSDGSAIVGERGPELLTVSNGRAVVEPLPGNTGRIESLLGDISGQLGGGPQTPIVVQVTLDGKVIGETALNYSRGRARANGN